VDVIAALAAGLPVLLPADGVYGLCSAPEEEPVLLLYQLKGRGREQPTAVIAASVETLLELIPELRGRPEAIIRAILPGPYTLIVPNPARRYAWLSRQRPDTIGVRVANVPADTQRVLDAVGLVAATSANDPGKPPAASLDAVPQRIRAGCGAELDAGLLPGEPSTVVDVSGDEPVVIREGAGGVAEVLTAARLP
jgi:L-threonylcarbamoyladenylate synthase